MSHLPEDKMFFFPEDICTFLFPGLNVLFPEDYVCRPENGTIPLGNGTFYPTGQYTICECVKQLLFSVLLGGFQIGQSAPYAEAIALGQNIMVQSVNQI